MKFKNSRRIIEDCLIPSIIEYALVNILANVLHENDVLPLGSKTELIEQKAISFINESEDNKNKLGFIYESYCKSKDIIDNELKIDLSKLSHHKNRLGNILSVISSNIRRNNLNTRFILLMALEWGKLLLQTGYIRENRDIDNLISDIFKEYDNLEEEFKDRDEFVDYYNKVLASAIDLHDLVLKSGYFQGCPEIEILSNAA